MAFDTYADCEVSGGVLSGYMQGFNGASCTILLVSAHALKRP